MAELIRDWAGSERVFNLRFGDLLDLEESCGKIGVGEIYLRLGQHRYFAKDVYNTIRLALIGGGLSAKEAKRLLDERFDVTPLSDSVEVAIDILVSVMAGVEDSGSSGKSDPSEPYDTGKLFASLFKAGFLPQQIREMAYADFVNMCRSLSDDGVKAPTEEEFEEMLERLNVSA